MSSPATNKTEHMVANEVSDDREDPLSTKQLQKRISVLHEWASTSPGTKTTLSPALMYRRRSSLVSGAYNLMVASDDDSDFSGSFSGASSVSGLDDSDGDDIETPLNQ